MTVLLFRRKVTTYSKIKCMMMYFVLCRWENRTEFLIKKQEINKTYSYLKHKNSSFFSSVVTHLPILLLFFFFIRTIFSRVTNDNRWFRTQPEVIDSLNFKLIGSEGICVIYVVFQPLGGGILPLLSGVSSSPPHQILQVWAVPVSVAYRLKAQVSFM